MNNLGLNVENLKGLVEGIKNLPCNLENLELDLSYNFIGEISENLNFFGEGIK